MASSSERAVNFAVRVQGVGDAQADFRKVGQAGEQAIGAIQKAAAAQATYEAALGKANSASQSFAAAQAAARQQLATLSAQVKAGTATEEQYQAAVLQTKNALALTRAEYSQSRTALDTAAKGVVATRVAMNDLDPVLDKVTRGTNNSRLAQLEWQHVMRATAGAALAGMDPLQALALEIPRIAEATQLSLGGTSKFAEFMGGPWGIALGLGAGAAIQLGLSMLAQKDKTAEALDELEKHAEKTRTDQQAQELFAGTLAGVTEAIEANRKAQEALNLVQDTAAEKTKKNAELEAERAQGLIALTKSQLAYAQSELAALEASSKYSDSETGNTAAISAVSDRIAKLQAQLGGAESALDEAQRQITTAKLAQVVEDASGSGSDKIKRSYDQQIDDARVAAQQAIDTNNFLVKSEAEKAKFVDATTAALKKQVEALGAARDAAVKNYEASQHQQYTGDMTQFEMPVNGRITGGFGDQRPGHLHAGIDIAVPVGTPVHAPAGGVVIEAGTVAGYGNVVFIDHGGGTISRLGHLSQIDVTKGAQVAQGAVIGLSGGARGAEGAGDSTGPHLHYEVRVNGRAVDPRKGAFNADPGSTADKADKAAQDALREVQDYQNRLATLMGAELQARRALVSNPETLAAIERAEIATAQKKYDDDLDSQVKEGKLAAEHAAQLKDINDRTAALKQELVDRAEQERKLTEQQAAAERAASYHQAQIGQEEALLKGQEELVQSQAERRELEHRLIALQYEQEKIQNDLVIAYAKRLEELNAVRLLQGQEGVDPEALRKAMAAAEQASLLNSTLGGRQANALASSDLGTAGPLEAYLAKQARTPQAINEKVQGYVVDELEAVRQGIDSAITSALGVKDPLLAGLIDLLVQTVLIDPLAEILQRRAAAGSSGGGLGGFLAHALGFVSAAVGGGGGVNFGASAGINFGGGSGLIPGTGFAGGAGDVPTGRPFWLGENGRELGFRTPGGALRVFSNQQVRHLLSDRSGPSIGHVTINIPQRADPRRTLSTVNRGIQTGLSRAARKGLAA